jgi:cytochrome d ubiquinol oxidase subunit I
MASTPLGVLAVELGWVVTEVGRQPWVIQGVMKRDEAVTQDLTGFEATLTLVGFAVVYLGLLSLYLYVVGRIVRAGPPAPADLAATADADGTPPDAAAESEVATDD